jgi:hypothetical protein
LIRLRAPFFDRRREGEEEKEELEEGEGGWRKQASSNVGHLMLEDDLDTAAATSFDFALFS